MEEKVIFKSLSRVFFNFYKYSGTSSDNMSDIIFLRYSAKCLNK